MPNSWIPGYHQFIVKIPESIKDNECSICYNKLCEAHDDEIDQMNNGETNQGSSQQPAPTQPITVDEKSQPMIKKMTKCMVTPCKHYFHEACLKLWLERKTECPICRAALRFHG